MIWQLPVVQQFERPGTWMRSMQTVARSMVRSSCDTVDSSMSCGCICVLKLIISGLGICRARQVSRANTGRRCGNSVQSSRACLYQERSVCVATCFRQGYVCRSTVQCSLHAA